MHMVGQYYPGLDAKRRLPTHVADGGAQRIDVPHQQVRPAIEQVYSEEVRSARYAISAIVRHPESMPECGISVERRVLTRHAGAHEWRVAPALRLGGAFLGFGEGLVQGGHADAMAEIAEPFALGAGRGVERKERVEHLGNAV
jgi:hypothetical protein